jgi:hypothetical protein
VTRPGGIDGERDGRSCELDFVRKRERKPGREEILLGEWGTSV